MSAEETLFQKFGRELARGMVLFREGEPGTEMFVVQSGRVVISKKVCGVETVLATLGPGEFFGEMAIISNKPRNATATVEEDARLLVIAPKTFEAMVRGNAEIAVRLIRKLAERLAEANAQIENLLHADPASRVVHHLLQLSQARGRPVPGGVAVDAPVGALPRQLGVGEPAIRTTLERLVRAGLLERQGDQLTLRDPARLRDYRAYLERKWTFGDL
jgi:CRP/FNR family cyclic AMP-dependent transcriptional regulator